MTRTADVSDLARPRLFEATDTPRVFAVPPGADFPVVVLDGLMTRLGAAAPDALSRVEVFVNTRRMERRLRLLLSAHGARLMPRLRLVGDIAATPGMPPGTGIAVPAPPLRRRLQIAQLVDRLLQQQPDLAPRSALFHLADSLAALIDEMQGEGAGPGTLDRLDVGDHADHWEQSLQFLRLVAPFLADDDPGPEAARRAQVEALVTHWQAHPPEHPVLVAGSTGSRHTTALLMDAVARLPQGALILPGFDTDLPADVWHGMAGPAGPEDHPQYRYFRLLDRLGLAPGDVSHWTPAPPPSPERNALVSLALRPAPVTDQWMSEGQHLSGLPTAAAGMTLVEAPSPRMEALAIALRLRKAVADGQRAALITPDRMLTRQVTAALDRWALVPDDSAGRPLALSAPGRFLRHVAALLTGPPGAEALVTLLKHPLTHSAGGRNAHLRATRELELHIRRNRLAFPGADALRAWGARHEAEGWADWLARTLPFAPDPGPQPLADRAEAHLALAEALARGPDSSDTGELWREAAGQSAAQAMTELKREAMHGGALSAQDFAALLDSLLQTREVRDPVTPHPGLMIWGTLEARVQGADLVILGGLNDGIWPQHATPDPWLNRRMRRDAGLLMPERQIGLSAHDFQQAIAAPEVMLARAVRDASAQTVPSRWLNRLVNLLQGLPAQGGTAALDAMRARGQHWLDLGRALEADTRALPAGATRRAPRPAPCPPASARPTELPVTGLARLIRDPYAVYARHVLGLRPLDPLHPQPDALLRGTVLHKVIEAYARAEPAADRHAQLMALTDTVLAEAVPWPGARALWRARMARVAPWFLAQERALRGTPVLLERKGSVTLDDPGFTLTARPDRIDLWPDGRVQILDFKTGTPPSKKQQARFDKQLLLEAAMAARGGFVQLGPRDVARITYVGLGATPKLEETDITADLDAQIWDGLRALIAAWSSPDQGYAARRMLFSERERSDYDHLARYGEWEQQDTPVPQKVGDHDA